MEEGTRDMMVGVERSGRDRKMENRDNSISDILRAIPT